MTRDKVLDAVKHLLDTYESTLNIRFALIGGQTLYLDLMDSDWDIDDPEVLHHCKNDRHVWVSYESIIAITF